MADTKISALSAASAAADANEFAINEAGTSKKLTAALLKTYCNAAPVFAAGSASAGTHPKLTAGAVLTTPEAGAIEYANDLVFATAEAGNRGVVSIEHWIRQSSSRTLSNSASEQKLFDSVTNGALNLAAGFYEFRCLLGLTGMSGSSGNAAFDILGAGGATLGGVLYHVSGADQGSLTNQSNRTGSFATTGQTQAAMVSAGTGSTLGAEIRGTFEVTAAGTIIPSVTLANAAAATVVAGTYFACRRLGTTSMVSVGDWS